MGKRPISTYFMLNSRTPSDWPEKKVLVFWLVSCKSVTSFEHVTVSYLVSSVLSPTNRFLSISTLLARPSPLIKTFLFLKALNQNPFQNQRIQYAFFTGFSMSKIPFYGTCSLFSIAVVFNHRSYVVFMSSTILPWQMIGIFHRNHVVLQNFLNSREHAKQNHPNFFCFSGSQGRWLTLRFQDELKDSQTIPDDTRDTHCKSKKWKEVIVIIIVIRWASNDISRQTHFTLLRKGGHKANKKAKIRGQT